MPTYNNRAMLVPLCLRPSALQVSMPHSNPDILTLEAFVTIWVLRLEHVEIYYHLQEL